jgi:hypothetical protein
MRKIFSLLCCPPPKAIIQSTHDGFIETSDSSTIDLPIPITWNVIELTIPTLIFLTRGSREWSKHEMRWFDERWGKMRYLNSRRTCEVPYTWIRSQDLHDAHSLPGWYSDTKSFRTNNCDDLVSFHYLSKRRQWSRERKGAQLKLLTTHMVWKFSPHYARDAKTWQKWYLRNGKPGFQCIWHFCPQSAKVWG